MKKKILCLFLCLVAIFSLCFLGACDDAKKPSGGGTSTSGGTDDGVVNLPMIPLG